MYGSYYSPYLMHHGVKGMKWGVRRYQNEDGTLTAAGKKRDAYLRAKDKYKSARGPKTSARAQLAMKNAKREFKDAKAQEGLSNQTKKSKHQLNLEKRYIAQGLNAKEAEIQAYKRVKVEKTLAVVGGMTLAAVGAYVAYKHYDNVTDRVLKQGFELGRIANPNEKGVHDAFYAFANKHDEKRYTGLYGAHIQGLFGSAVRKNIKVVDSVKVASRKSARDTMGKLVANDPEYKRKLLKTISDYEANISRNMGSGKVSGAIRDLTDGKVTDRVYDAANVALVYHDDNSNEVSKRFYDALKKAGYAALRDVNDSKYSGYGTKNPLIIFDSSKVNVESAKALGKKAVESANRAEMGKLVAKQSAKQMGIQAGLYGSLFGIPIGAALASDKTNENKFVQEYRNNHPESKLSRNDILAIRDAEILGVS